MLLQKCMRRPPFNWPRIDVHSAGFQITLEIVAGAVFTALLLRWLM